MRQTARFGYGSIVLLVSVVMLFASVAQAMEIIQFDKMAVQDQADYITVLVDGAQRVLIVEGKNDLAAQIHKLFTEVHSGDRMTLGMIAFEENLDRARLFDAESHARDHNAQRVEVEDAMAATLKKNGIELPDSFFNVASNFKPKLPLAKQ
jgi:hypothetical protein